MARRRVSPARASWRISYRSLRVARREHGKAMLDLVSYGTGVVYVPHDGSDPRHIPLTELRFYGGFPKPAEG